MGVELSPQSLLELVRLPRSLGLGFDEGLDREQIDLHGLGIIHSRPHDGRVEVVRRDDDRLETHRPQQALWVTRREVVLGLVQNCSAGCDDDEIPDPVRDHE